MLELIPEIVMNDLSQLNYRIQADDCPEEISTVLDKTVLVGGKRLRPLLTILMGQLFDACRKEVLTAAVVIEQVHAATLSHDDVIDNASSRRGAPSINVLADNKKAVLAGDFLLADSMVKLCELNNARLVSEVAKVIQQLVAGEWLQLELAQSRDYSIKQLQEVSQMKTGSVMSWCAVAPAILSGSDEFTVERCREFGNNVGVAFQMIDDALDFSKTSRKDQLQDLNNETVNFVIYEWLSKNSRAKEQFDNGEKLSSLSINQQELNAAVEKVREAAKSKIDEAKEILQEIVKESDSRLLLEKLLDYLSERKS